MMSGRNNVLSENNPPSPSKTENQRLMDRVIQNQNLIIQGQQRSDEQNQRSEERHRESLIQAEERTLDIINAQRALFIGQLERVRAESISRIEAVEGQVLELQQTLKNQSNDGKTNLPGDSTMGQLEFIHRNHDGTRDRFVVSYDQVIKQGKVRGICPFCTLDYAHNYLKRHIVNTCFKKYSLNANYNIPSNDNNC